MQQISKLLIEKMAMFLMAYGNTPNSIMGESLAHLLHEKSLPTCLHFVNLPVPIQLSELQILVMPRSDLLQMVSVSTPAAASPLEENVVSPTKVKWQYPFKVCKAPQGLSLNCYLKRQ